MTTKTDDIKLPNLPLGCVDYPAHFPSGAKVMLVEAAEVYARAAVEADRQGRMPSDEEIIAEFANAQTSDGNANNAWTLYPDELVHAVHALLSRYGRSQPDASAEPGETEALRDMLDDARSDLEMLRNALGVPVEPHQNLLERMLNAAKVAAPVVQESAVDESVVRFYKKLFTCERADAERYRWSISAEENADSLKSAVITYTGDRVMINRRIDERRTGK